MEGDKNYTAASHAIFTRSTSKAFHQPSKNCDKFYSSPPLPSLHRELFNRSYLTSPPQVTRSDPTEPHLWPQTIRLEASYTQLLEVDLTTRTSHVASCGQRDLATLALKTEA